MKKFTVIFFSMFWVVASVSFCHGFEDPFKILFKGQKHPTINEQNLTPRKKLGFILFFDKNLSNPLVNHVEPAMIRSTALKI